MSAGKIRQVMLWVVTVLLAAFFLIAGLPKLSAPDMIVEMFAGWGYAKWFVHVTGVLEVLGAILLVIPRVARYGAALLIVLMLGAAYTHVTHGEAAELARPLIPAALLVWVGWERTRKAADRPAS